jgi:hypothetical protein
VTPADYRLAIRRVGLTQAAAGSWFGGSTRSGQRWSAVAGPGPPPAVARCLSLMLALGWSAADVDRFISRAQRQRESQRSVNDQP